MDESCPICEKKEELLDFFSKVLDIEPRCPECMALYLQSQSKEKVKKQFVEALKRCE